MAGAAPAGEGAAGSGAGDRPPGGNALSPEALADPVVFAREVGGLGLVTPGGPSRAAVRDHDRVSATSGHKTGKSTSFAILAWWFTADPVHRPARGVR